MVASPPFAANSLQRTSVAMHIARRETREAAGGYQLSRRQGRGRGSHSEGPGQEVRPQAARSGSASEDVERPGRLHDDNQGSGELPVVTGRG
eukprot:357967-Chlamydomonas_euryale.AAC.1